MIRCQTKAGGPHITSCVHAIQHNISAPLVHIPTLLRVCYLLTAPAKQWVASAQVKNQQTALLVLLDAQAAGRRRPTSWQLALLSKASTKRHVCLHKLAKALVLDCTSVCQLIYHHSRSPHAHASISQTIPYGVMYYALMKLVVRTLPTDSQLPSPLAAALLEAIMKRDT